MSEQLIVSASPHIRTRVTTRRIMLDVVIALMPCVVAGIVFFGWYAFALTAISVGSAVLTELVYSLVARKAWKDFGGTLREIVRDFDLTSVVTGVILALILPVGVAWYLAFLGGIFAIALCKMLCGGTGRNLVKAADTARVHATMSYAGQVTRDVRCDVSLSELAGGPATVDLGDFGKLSAPVSFFKHGEEVRA